MGKKAPHTTVIPLRKRHHDEFYTVGKLPWEAKYGSLGRLGCLGAKPVSAPLLDNAARRRHATLRSPKGIGINSGHHLHIFLGLLQIDHGGG